MPGGPLFVDFLRSIALANFFLDSGGRKTVEFDATPGGLFGFDMFSNTGFMVPVAAGAAARSRQDVEVRIVDHGHLVSAEALLPGPTKVEFLNETAGRVSQMLNIMPPDKKSLVLEFEPFLNGKSLFNNQTFRALYPTATLGAGGGIGVKDLTLLFTDLKGSTALYDRIGDLKAFTLVQQHFERLTKAIQSSRGAVVKTIGDAVMASFDRPDDAVRAAVGMLKEIETFNDEHGEKEIILKIGIHRGASIAVTLNERLDYFGQTVNIAARVQGLAGSEEIYLTRNVYQSSGVKELLAGFRVNPETQSLKGVQRAMQVFRVRPPAPAGSAHPARKPPGAAKQSPRRNPRG